MSSIVRPMKKVWAAFAVLSAARPVAADAPITAVTVYSDRARVTRTAVVNVAGRQRVALALLGERVDAGSIRLESPSAEVQMVDLRWVEGDQAFPMDEARTVLAALETIDGDLSRARRDRHIYATSEALDVIEPVVPGIGALRPAPRLSSSGWDAVIAFARRWSETAQARGRELDLQIQDLTRKRADLAEAALRLGSERRRGGWRVSATVIGNGEATLHLSYMMMGARWHPTYDILLDPATQNVAVHFAGLVSQETGEDWPDALITLSTAIPATTTAYPKVFTWKIGERERFIPRPRPYVEPLPPPPPAAPSPRAAGDESQRWRQELLARATRRPEASDLESEKDALLERKREILRKQKAGDQEEGSVESRVVGGRAGGVVGGVAASPAAPPPAPPRMSSSPSSSPPSTAPSVMPEPPSEALAAPPSLYDSVDALSESAPSSRSARRSQAQAVSFAEPAVAFGIAPPPGYRQPVVSPDLPAALAGGYDLTYRAAGPETVASGKGARRVALFSRSFPVTVERRLFPDLAPEAAFIVAELKNPGAEPLPGGRARLFVGADPAGVAQIKTVGAQETFTLPLGLDRSIKAIRNVKVVTALSGFISKDETSEYTVTIEVVNPTRAPLRARVVDQLPVTDDKDVAIKLVRASPAASVHDAVTGKIEWRLTIPSSSKAAISFVYTLKRPKGYRLRQAQ